MNSPLASCYSRALRFSRTFACREGSNSTQAKKSCRFSFCALGIATYSVAFSLVAVNIAVHFVRDAPVVKAPFLDFNDPRVCCTTLRRTCVCKQGKSLRAAVRRAR